MSQADTGGRAGGERAAGEKTSLRKQVQAILIAEDRFSLAGSLGLFLAGLGWCMGIGIILATLLWFLVGWTWFGWLGIYWLVLIAIMVVWQRSNRRGYVVAALSDDVGEATTVGEVYAKHALSGVPALGLLVAWGPRQMVDGLAALRGRGGANRNLRFKRAAQAVLELAKQPGGVGVKSIMHPPEDMPTFIWAMDWLDKHDYIGRSTDGERVWFSTIGRKKLADKGVTPKIALGG